MMPPPISFLILKLCIGAFIIELFGKILKIKETSFLYSEGAYIFTTVVVLIAELNKIMPYNSNQKIHRNCIKRDLCLNTSIVHLKQQAQNCAILPEFFWLYNCLAMVVELFCIPSEIQTIFIYQLAYPRDFQYHLNILFQSQ